MCGHPGRPVPFFAVLLAPGGELALFVPAAGAGCRIDPHHPIQAAIEALAKCPSLPLGWKTGAAALQERRRRAARAPNVPGQGLDPAEPVMYLPWTGDRPVMYPPYTCAGDTPGSPGREVRLCRCERGARPTGAKSGVKNRGRFHLQRPRYGPTLDRGAGKSHLVAGGNPATGPMRPQIKSPLLRVFDNTSWCRVMLLPAGPCGNPRDPLPPGTGRCRAVPRHPSKHGANMETARSRPIRRKPSPLPGRALPAVWSAGMEAASVMNTVRNIRLHRQRD